MTVRRVRAKSYGVAGAIGIMISFMWSRIIVAGFITAAIGFPMAVMASPTDDSTNRPVPFVIHTGDGKYAIAVAQQHGHDFGIPFGENGRQLYHHSRRHERRGLYHWHQCVCLPTMDSRPNERGSDRVFGA